MILLTAVLVAAAVTVALTVGAGLAVLLRRALHQWRRPGYVHPPAQLPADEDDWLELLSWEGPGGERPFSDGREAA